MNIPKFNTKRELFDFLIKNKSALIAEKKYQTKHGDVVITPSERFIDFGGTGEEATKAIENPSEFTGNKLKVSSVINTTKIMDSHFDVHLDNIWSKSAKEVKNVYLLEEHKMSFRNIISDEVKVEVKIKPWKDLGYDAEGTTQALVFHSILDKDRNEYMFEQYLKGRVKNHSVGMQYVSLSLAINDSKYKDEFAVWQKYVDKIINKDMAEEVGYFWAVHEAKIIEGSAVPLGSNKVTPTLAVEEKQHQENESEEEATQRMNKAKEQEKLMYYQKLLKNEL